MWRSRIMPTIVLALIGLSNINQAASREITYDDFMKLGLGERQARFARVTPENQATLKRTHAQRWLTANSGRLTSAQMTVVQDAIAFLTPDLYRHPQATAGRRTEEDLKTRLVCSLGHDAVIEAFTFFPKAQGQTWNDLIDSWLSWFSDCVLK